MQLLNKKLFSQNGCRQPFWMTENHFRSHFSPFQINRYTFIFFTKWPPAAILDDRKSLSIAFLAISDQYTAFCLQNGHRHPFWMTENHFRSHLSTFQINTQIFFFFEFFTKWLPAAILDYDVCQNR